MGITQSRECYVDEKLVQSICGALGISAPAHRVNNLRMDIAILPDRNHWCTPLESLKRTPPTPKEDSRVDRCELMQPGKCWEAKIAGLFQALSGLGKIPRGPIVGSSVRNQCATYLAISRICLLKLVMLSSCCHDLPPARNIRASSWGRTSQVGRSDCASVSVRRNSQACHSIVMFAAHAIAAKCAIDAWLAHGGAEVSTPSGCTPLRHWVAGKRQGFLVAYMAIFGLV